jgi:MtN3 and saliva related transmembrane protein
VGKNSRQPSINLKMKKPSTETLCRHFGEKYAYFPTNDIIETLANALLPSCYMNWTQVVGLFAGICTASSLLPQLIKTIREKKAEDISKGMLFVLMTGVATWIVYGILREDLPIIITNSFSLLLNICMIVLRLKYNR